MKTEELHLQPVIPEYQSQLSQDRLLTPAEVADILRVSVQSLKLWRKNGTGPAWVKINNSSVRYSEASLYKWLNCECNPLHSLKPNDQIQQIGQVT